MPSLFEKGRQTLGSSKARNLMLSAMAGLGLSACANSNAHLDQPADGMDAFGAERSAKVSPVTTVNPAVPPAHLLKHASAEESNKILQNNSDDIQEAFNKVIQAFDGAENIHVQAERATNVLYNYLNTHDVSESAFEKMQTAANNINTLADNQTQSNNTSELILGELLEVAALIEKEAPVMVAQREYNPDKRVYLKPLPRGTAYAEEAIIAAMNQRAAPPLQEDMTSDQVMGLGINGLLKGTAHNINNALGEGKVMHAEAGYSTKYGPQINAGYAQQFGEKKEYVGGVYAGIYTSGMDLSHVGVSISKTHEGAGGTGRDTVTIDHAITPEGSKPNTKSTTLAWSGSSADIKSGDRVFGNTSYTHSTRDAVEGGEYSVKANQFAGNIGAQTMLDPKNSIAAEIGARYNKTKHGNGTSFNGTNLNATLGYGYTFTDGTALGITAEGSRDISQINPDENATNYRVGASVANLNGISGTSMNVYRDSRGGGNTGIMARLTFGGDGNDTNGEINFASAAARLARTNDLYQGQEAQSNLAPSDVLNGMRNDTRHAALLAAAMRPSHVADAARRAAETVKQAAKKAGTPTVEVADTIAPAVAGVADSTDYSVAVTPTFTEGTATLAKDGGAAAAYTSGTAISAAGDYVLTVTDTAGNATTVNFEMLAFTAGALEDNKAGAVVGALNDAAAYFNANDWKVEILKNSVVQATLNGSDGDVAQSGSNITANTTGINRTFDTWITKTYHKNVQIGANGTLINNE